MGGFVWALVSTLGVFILEAGMLVCRWCVGGVSWYISVSGGCVRSYTVWKTAMCFSGHGICYLGAGSEGRGGY
ncbi:hypothetical protein F5Y07DRAFT_379543 [Xylaria sp. FL0933]|nr:hypothetical protein F5Y07DRAFT_379543 [Xylaria sp. FL0933]